MGSERTLWAVPPRWDLVEADLPEVAHMFGVGTLVGRQAVGEQTESIRGLGNIYIGLRVFDSESRLAAGAGRCGIPTNTKPYTPDPVNLNP